MPTECEPVDDETAADIIDRAFPKYKLIWAPDPNLDVADLSTALFRARSKCGGVSLGECIKWARRILYK